MEDLFPREIWSEIFKYDPTYHEKWDVVKKELHGQNCGRRCEAGGLHHMKAFDGLTDLSVTVISNARLITVTCRLCNLTICASVPQESCVQN